MTTEDRETVRMMEQYGGSFIKALTRAIYFADINNFEKIKRAFPDEWKKYENWGRLGEGLENVTITEYTP